VKNKRINEQVIWKDRKRRIFGLPFSFTRYIVYADKLIVSRGFFNIVEDELLLYKVLDIELILPFRQRIYGLGTVKLMTADVTDPDTILSRIKKPRYVKDMVDQLVNNERTRLSIKGREMYGMSQNDLQHDISNRR